MKVESRATSTESRDMCGRFTLITLRDIIAEEFGLEESSIPPYVSRYNIAPSQKVPVLLRKPALKMDFFRWGLIPSWAKDASMGNRMINARQKTLIEKPSFGTPLKANRCLILADGFYEWKREGRTKTPYYIHLKSLRPFSLAGFWSKWRDQDGKEIRTCTIITGKPNALVQTIHDRMPVILSKEKREQWLDPSIDDLLRLTKLLEVFPADEMEVFPVSTRVNSPAFDTPECNRNNH